MIGVLFKMNTDSNKELEWVHSVKVKVGPIFIIGTHKLVVHVLHSRTNFDNQHFTILNIQQNKRSMITLPSPSDLMLMYSGL
jgi:hypothetical protein